MPKKSTDNEFIGKIRKPSKPKGSTWGFVVLPSGINQSLARRGRITVNVSMNGLAFQATLEPDGKLGHWLKIDRTLLIKAGISIGDEADFSIKALDEEPRPIPPDDLATALKANAVARESWNDTTAIAQVDWIHWIESAKQSSTREKRVANTINMLSSGKKRVCCFDPSGFYSKALSAPVEAID